MGVPLQVDFFPLRSIIFMHVPMPWPLIHISVPIGFISVPTTLLKLSLLQSTMNNEYRNQQKYSATLFLLLSWFTLFILNYAIC